MIRLAQPYYLLLLAIIPLLVLLYYLHIKRRKKKLERLSDRNLHPILLDARHEKRMHLRFILFSLSLLLLTVSLAGPEIGTRYEEIKISGVDIVIGLDISASMNAEDIKPNRLEKAKHAIGALLSQMGGDRVALVIFSGAAFIQCPLTTDYSAIRMFLDAISSSSTTAAGTDFPTFLETASGAFLDEKDDVAAGRALVVLSDGEDHVGIDPSVIEQLKTKRLRLFALGVGTSAGAPIPIYDETGGLRDYKRQSGSVVTSRLEEKVLKQLAEETGGAYFPITSSDAAVEKIYTAISGLEKGDHAEYQFTAFENRFQWFVAPGLALLAAFVLLPLKRNREQT